MAAFRERLKSASMALNTAVTEESRLSCFKTGLPCRLQNHLLLAKKDSGKIVSTVCRLFSTQIVVTKETIRELGELDAVRSALVLAKGEQAHVKCC